MMRLGALRVLCVVAVLAVAYGRIANAGPLDDGLYALDRKDFKHAFEILEPLARAGDAPAQRLVGRMYQEGTGVERNPSTALDWLKKAAEQGEAEAQLAVGQIYRFGWSVEKNPSEGLK